MTTLEGRATDERESSARRLVETVRASLLKWTAAEGKLSLLLLIRLKCKADLSSSTLSSTRAAWASERSAKRSEDEYGADAKRNKRGGLARGAAGVRLVIRVACRRRGDALA